MEHIKIKGSDQCYEIQSIMHTAEHILQIVFADAAPKDWGEIQLYTAGDILATTLEGWTIAELQSSKKQEISQACEQAIYSGVSVTLTDGSVEHFALTEHDQLNLFGKQVQLAAGAEQLEYHSDGQPCRYYDAADMQKIITKAMWHVSYHTTYCNALNMWISGAQTAEEIQQIFYGADVPEQYQSEVLKAYLLQIAAMAGDDVDAQTTYISIYFYWMWMACSMC